MTTYRLWLREQQDNLKNAVTSFIKTKVCLLAAVAVAFSAMTGMTASQLKNYTVYADGQQKTVVTDKTDKAAILSEAGVSVSDVDVVKTEKTDNEINLYVIRKSRLKITADGKTTEYVVKRDTVGNVLKEIGVNIAENDTVNLSLEDKLPESAEITIDRVEYKTIKKDEIVTYSQFINLVKTDDNLDKNALSQGQRAVITTVYENKMVNGKVAETVVVDRLVQPIATKSVINNASGKATCGDYSTVTAVSTLKPTIDIVLDEKGIPVNYKKLITGKATAYYAEEGARTSTGKVPQPGYIAVNPKQIPYGTKMYIRTPDNRIIYGYAVAADTGGFIYGGRTTADLYFNTYEECVQFGVKDVEIYILD